jgi:hypothetical protein
LFSFFVEAAVDLLGYLQDLFGIFAGADPLPKIAVFGILRSTIPADTGGSFCFPAVHLFLIGLLVHSCLNVRGTAKSIGGRLYVSVGQNTYAARRSWIWKERIDSSSCDARHSPIATMSGMSVLMSMTRRWFWRVWEITRCRKRSSCTICGIE